jgi:hypothetical protein
LAVTCAKGYYIICFLVVDHPVQPCPSLYELLCTELWPLLVSVLLILIADIGRRPFHQNLDHANNANLMSSRDAFGSAKEQKPAWCLCNPPKPVLAAAAAPLCKQTWMLAYCGTYHSSNAGPCNLLGRGTARSVAEGAIIPAPKSRADPASEGGASPWRHMPVTRLHRYLGRVGLAHACLALWVPLRICFYGRHG